MAEGKASFGFVSKYKKGANKPDGQTQFEFHAVNFNFHSTAYDWLVVSGSKAQYKGVGNVNGLSGFGFMLTAIDNTPEDRFRIKIWELDTERVVYDTQIGMPDDADAETPLSKGSITIHSGGKGKNASRTVDKGEEWLATDKILVYPNPLTTDGLWIEIPAMEDTPVVQARLYDLSGRLMAEESFTTGAEGCKHFWKLEHSEWASGMYLLMLRGENFYQQLKIIK